jgi:hypothetical protein
MNQEIAKKPEDEFDRALAEIERAAGSGPVAKVRLPPATAAVPPASTMSVDQQFDVYSRAGPALRKRIIAERADITGKFERDMAAHIEDSRARADQLRAAYEQRINELDQIARRIGE